MRTVLVRTTDRYSLMVNCYEPFAKGGVEHGVEHVVIINSGAGIPQTFYGPFSAWLADHGFCVLTYDYRGIGGSRGASIKGFKATIQDWGSKDCAATIAYASTIYPAKKLYVLGHSIGSVVTGFVSQLPKIERMLLISPHTGYFGDYAQDGKWRMFLMWHFFMPVISRAFGYFPGRLLGLPEDLPYSVALEWGKRWRKRDLRGDETLGRFARVATRALVLRPADDPFATKSAYDRVREQYSNIHFADKKIFAPNSIGFFYFCRRHHRDSLWPIGLQWLAFGEVLP